MLKQEVHENTAYQHSFISSSGKTNANRRLCDKDSQAVFFCSLHQILSLVQQNLILGVVHVPGYWIMALKLIVFLIMT
jgi:hypothetical protein